MRRVTFCQDGYEEEKSPWIFAKKSQSNYSKMFQCKKKKKRNKVILAIKDSKIIQMADLSHQMFFSLVTSQVAPRLRVKQQIKIGMNTRKQM